jgi:hypothetical protein
VSAGVNEADQLRLVDALATLRTFGPLGEAPGSDGAPSAAAAAPGEAVDPDPAAAPAA